MELNDLEHERKYLVEDLAIIRQLGDGTSIVQGYLRSAVAFSVRVRLYPTLDTYQLTVKSARGGITRTEEEVSIPRSMAEALFDACGHAVIEKTRYPAAGPDGQGWDVDVFHGANEGLVMAEIELNEPDNTFALPEWCGVEVTDDDRYYNEYLAFNPYTSWATGGSSAPNGAL